MNRDCITTLLNHRSIRKYKREEVNEEDLKTILEASRRAPTGWGLGWIDIIVVKDKALKNKIAELVGDQKHVSEAPVLLVFVIDYARLMRVLEKVGAVPAKPNIGFLLAGFIDAGIVSSFAAIAAENLGYGICYIAVYSALCEIAELLDLPPGSLPVIGLTIGVPEENPGLRPRVSIRVLVDFNKYSNIEEKVDETLTQLRGYMEDTWKLVLSRNGVYESVGDKLLECLRKQGFNI